MLPIREEVCVVREERYGKRSEGERCADVVVVVDVSWMCRGRGRLFEQNARKAAP